MCCKIARTAITALFALSLPIAALFMFALPIAAPAFGHALLVRAVPPAGATVAVPPHEVTLVFTEKVEPAFCQVQVLDPSDGAVAAGKAHGVRGNDRALSVSVPRLSPGRYTVVWHATAADTHRTEGRFTFTVAPK
ncbi:MAG: copper resistance CopC family protein [Acetobacteraceae bacterium]